MVNLAPVWQGVRGDLEDWLDDYVPGDYDQGLTFRFADIQARLADALRFELDLAGYGPERREAVVMDTLTRFRDVVRLVGLTDDDTIIDAAQRVLGVTQARVDTAVNTMRLEAIREARMEALRAKGSLTWTWRAKLDRRTCPYCVSMHGTEHAMGTPMLSHPNCRCIPTLGTKETGWAWLRKQSKAMQDRILHPRVARAWRGHRLTEQDIVDPDKMRRRNLGQLFGRGDSSLSDEGMGERRYRREATLRKHTESMAIKRRRIVSEDFPDMDVKFLNTGMTPEQEAELERTLRHVLPHMFDAAKTRMGTGSTWNGEIIIRRLPGAYGIKTWDSTITLDIERWLPDQPGWVHTLPDDTTIRVNPSAWKTLQHELLHSFSNPAALAEDYMADKASEEGPVEIVAHDLLADVFHSATGIPRPDDSLWSYDEYTAEVRALAEAIGVDPADLSVDILNRSLETRSEWAYQQAADALGISLEQAEDAVSMYAEDLAMRGNRAMSLEEVVALVKRGA